MIDIESINHKFFLSILISLLILPEFCQAQNWTRADTLRGALRLERTSYDVLHYHLRVSFDFESKSIRGSNDILFRMDSVSSEIQVDLFENMQINAIQYLDKTLDFRRVDNAVFIDARDFNPKQEYKITISYQGQPKIARMPPWDGGFIWREHNETPWVAVACQGLGASVWWPNKDHLSDEPDHGVDLEFNIPKDLELVSNGRLINLKTEENNKNFHWRVSHPINNYSVTFNITDYVHFSDLYITRDNDSLSLDYYVLEENLDKAKSHFLQTKDVLEAFEHYFGKYPFIEDGFKLIETPYLGMEHQSAIAYGNRYMRGYLGGMIPPEMDYDYIILHETGHEYFGNALSCQDFAEIWIHESFTTYMEALFVEYHRGQKDAERYLSFQRRHHNIKPIIGPLGVNHDETTATDHYFKGAWVLHTLRHHINDDEKWFDYLKSLYENFKFKPVDSEDIFAFSNAFFGQNLRPFFEQYLRNPSPPRLKYNMSQSGKDLLINVKWEADVPNFEMGLKIGANDKYHYYPINSMEWTQILIPNANSESLQFASHQFLFELQ